ncbi:hypothetical protein LXL04_036411 [Taraxacum kok-saghyz]
MFTRLSSAPLKPPRSQIIAVSKSGLVVPEKGVYRASTGADKEQARSRSNGGGLVEQTAAEQAAVVEENGGARPVDVILPPFDEIAVTLSPNNRVVLSRYSRTRQSSLKEVSVGEGRRKVKLDTISGGSMEREILVVLITRIVSVVIQKSCIEFPNAFVSNMWMRYKSTIRSNGEIVINVASSGIASLLLEGGRTTHSRFKIPLNLNDDSLCSIKSGNFRQTLPVIPNRSRQDIVGGSLSSSYIWRNCKVMKLTRNMRLSVQTSNVEEINTFGNWILDIGEGKVGGLNDGEAMIDIPDDLLINDSFYPIGSLIDFVYPSIVQNVKNPNFFQERAILTPKNEVVQ